MAVVTVKALACELPAETGVPLSRWSAPDLAVEAVEALNAGELVESGFVVEVLDTPKEDYTKRLLASSPAVN